MTRQHDWADNHTFAARRIHRPESVDDLRRIVAGGGQIRALGSRRSFSGIADSPGDLVDPGGIAPDPTGEFRNAFLDAHVFG